MRQSAFGLLDSHSGGTGWEAAAHGPADAVTIPDAHLLFSGNFKRAGTDLILSDDTQKFIVHDYFRGEHRPTLQSPDGARLSADVVEALTGHGAYAQAAATPNAVVAVGRVAKVEGSATIVRNGVAITVNSGDAVLKGDVLQTGAGVLGVTFADGSTLSLTANSRLMVDDFVYDSNGSANSEVLNLVQGSLSFISGEVAHTGGNMKITTPVATMGIRGTVGGVTQASDGTVSFFVVESATGAVVTDNAGHVLFQVMQNGPLIQVRPAGPLQVIAEEVQKSPQELTVELAILQQIVSTQVVGQQIIQHFQDLQNNQGPHSTGTDHTQIQIDIPKSIFTDAGTGGTIIKTQIASNTAIVTTTTTDQSGNTTTTTDQVPFQPAPTPPPNSGTTVQWTGASDNNANNSANWNPNKSPTSLDDVIIGSSQDENLAIVAANGPFDVHSLTLSDGAQLQADDVAVGGNLAILGDASTTKLAGQSPLTIHGVAGDLFVHAIGGDAEITACGDLSIGPVAGTFTVEAVVPAVQFASANAEIRAAGHDLTIGAIGGRFLLSATVEDHGNGSATAEISAANVTIGNVGHDFKIIGDACSSAFAEISATCGDVSIGNIVGDFLNQGLIDADNGVLSIGKVGGTFVNDGVMRAYELAIATNDNGSLDNQGKIIESGGSGRGDDVGTIGVDLYNSGLFKVTDGAGLEFNSSVHNYDCGTIVASDCGGIAFNDPVFNSGLIKASHDGEIDFNAGIHNFGTIEAASFGSIHFGDGSVDNCHIIEANSGGTIDFSHWVDGNGTLAMDGGTIELASGTCNTIDFSGDCGGVLVLDSCGAPSLGQIEGFGPDDSIDFANMSNLSIVGYADNTGRLELHSGSAGDFYLSFTGDGTNYTVDNFVLSSYESGDQTITTLTERPVLTLTDPEVTQQQDGGGTISGLAILEPFAGDMTITASLQDAADGTLALACPNDLLNNDLIDDGSDGTLVAKATLDEIKSALIHGITYTPSGSPPTFETISVMVTDGHESDEIDFVFNVADPGPDGVHLSGTGNKDFIYATGNNDTLCGVAAGSDTFVFQPAQSVGGHDIINNFDSAKDNLFFDKSIFASAEDVLQHAHDNSANVVICEGNNETITLTGIHVQDLQASHILISA